MPETITQRFDGMAAWKWHDMIRDLEQQGGLENILIDPLSVGANSCMGEHNGNRFAVSWEKDVLLMLTIVDDSKDLIDAFARVVDYQPFCRYIQIAGEHELTVVEWAKNDADERFAKLQKDRTPGLKRI
jgi:hypothetical protein